MMADDQRESHEPKGHIKLICGPMFAGKSTMLIQLLANASRGGLRVIACKPLRDTRYAEDRIVTHDGNDVSARQISGSDQLIACSVDTDVVGVDEFHFFDATFVKACEDLANRGQKVICAGVDLDHRGELFDSMAAISQVAHEIVRLTSTCTVCGLPATMTQRMIESDERIVVGGAGDYEPRCTKCFERIAS